MSITINNADDIAKMRIAGKLASEVLDYITPFVVHGVTTEKLDQLCHDYIVNVQQAIPAPLNYAPDGHTPYPKSICTSVNHVICHGVPGDKVLKNGDTVNIDITVICQAPKLAPYISEMRQNLLIDTRFFADQIHTAGCINIKATTEEKMGYTGRGEGISCHAVALLVPTPPQPRG